jgi:2-oxoglutarate dehydrogenase E2 component (dihydrolipoamide succinyltransferase)
MKSVVSVPTVNANDDNVVVVRWHVPDLGKIGAGGALVDVETTKAVVTIPAEGEGWVRRCCREGDEVPVGAPLAWVFSDKAECDAAEPPGPGAPPAPVQRAPATPAGGFSATRLSPAAEKLAVEKGLDPAALAALKLGLVNRARLEAGLGGAPAGAPAGDALRRERVSPSKRTEIQALREGVAEGLTSSLTLYLDSAGVRAAAAAQGRSFLPIVLAELARLLAEHPRFTSFHDAGSTVFHDAVHLGVAVDVGQGLRMVTLRDAAGQDSAALERRLSELTLDVMENTLGLADAQGATFTVSDLSSLDIMQFEPLLNARQAAILGVGGDSTLPGYPVSLTLVFDHRVLTGREVAVFLRTLRDRILDRGLPAHGPGMGPAPGTPGDGRPCCDRCLIDLGTYYAKFGPAGVMHQYARPDGSTGLICHACLASF